MPRKNTDPVQAIQALARSFPELARRPGTDPWDPAALDACALELVMHRRWGLRSAAQFVLGVWDRSRLWRFEAVAAMAAWDLAARAAFLTWAEDPWWVEDGRVRRPVASRS